MTSSDRKPAAVDARPGPGRSASILLAVLLGGGAVRVALHPWLEAPLGEDYVAKRLVADAWKVVLFVALPLALLVRAERAPMRSVVSLPKGERPRAAVAVALLWIALVLIVDASLGRAYASWPGGMPWRHLALGFVSTFLAAATEEFAFRGLLLPRLAASTGWYRGQLAAAAAFAVVHLPGWILLGGTDVARALGLAAQVALFGAVLGLVTLWSGRLAPAIALHFLNNLASGPAFR